MSYYHVCAVIDCNIEKKLTFEQHQSYHEIVFKLFSRAVTAHDNKVVNKFQDIQVHLIYTPRSRFD